MGAFHYLIQTLIGTNPYFPICALKNTSQFDFLIFITGNSNGNLWMATEKGLVIFDPTPDLGLHCKLFERSDGLPYEGSIIAPLFRSRSGKIFVPSKYGSQNGFYCFHPDSVILNTHIPQVVITDFKVRNNPFILDSNISLLKHINLRYNENYLSFEFAALDYVNTGKNQYAYKLEGIDDNWISSGNRRFAAYTSVPPGNYTFFVKGSNNDGIWNEKGTSLLITIDPPPWKTWWAFTIYGLVLGFMVYGLRQYDLKRQRLKQKLEIEQVEAEKLKELDSMKSRFFANISHEFRTPLTLILGPLDKHLQKLKDKGLKKDMSIMQRNARRLQKLINQLLDLSKLESGKMKLHAQELDAIPLIRGYVQSFESLAKQKSIELSFQVAAAGAAKETAAATAAAAGKKDLKIPVYADQDKLEKILFNLLSNAFKYTSEGGRIEIEVCSWQFAVGRTSQVTSHKSHIDSLLISISDTGSGIPPEKLPHIFDRFYQTDDIYTKDGEGTGIGLALTKELVELHHGSIEVQSEVGVGTTFLVYLPLGNEHLTPEELGEKGERKKEQEEEIGNWQLAIGSDSIAKDRAPCPVPCATDRDEHLILIVEDNTDLRLYIRTFLDQSYQVIEAEDGRQGFERALEHIPDLIISDVMMPQMDGYELCIKLKTNELTSHIPVILLTARASKESKIEGLETGADDFIVKPFDSDELIIRIKNLLDQRKRLSRLIEERIQKSVVPGYLSIEDSNITSMDEQFLKKAFDTMKENYSDPEFNVEEFSQEMNMSRNQLHRKIKALTRHTAVEFIRSYRLNRAAEFIKKKSATIAEIAYDVGFSSPSYFSECFQKQFGILPSDYSGDSK